MAHDIGLEYYLLHSHEMTDSRLIVYHVDNFEN